MRQILVVDDDEQMTKMLRILLQPRGFDVTSARDGELGLQMALSHERVAPTATGLSEARDCRTGELSG